MKWTCPSLNFDQSIVSFMDVRMEILVEHAVVYNLPRLSEYSDCPDPVLCAASTVGVNVLFSLVLDSFRL